MCDQNNSFLKQLVTLTMLEPWVCCPTRIFKPKQNCYYFLVFVCVSINKMWMDIYLVSLIDFYFLEGREIFFEVNTMFLDNAPVGGYTNWTCIIPCDVITSMVIVNRLHRFPSEETKRFPLGGNIFQKTKKTCKGEKIWGTSLNNIWPIWPLL